MAPWTSGVWLGLWFRCACFRWWWISAWAWALWSSWSVGSRSWCLSRKARSNRWLGASTRPQGLTQLPGTEKTSASLSTVSLLQVRSLLTWARGSLSPPVFWVVASLRPWTPGSPDCLWSSAGRPSCSRGRTASLCGCARQRRSRRTPALRPRF